MSTHRSNAAWFANAATASPDYLTQAYFGLVAIELLLKSKTPLPSHDVPGGLDSFALLQVHNQKKNLNSLAKRLRNDIKAVVMHNKNGSPQAAPSHSYPYIRYARLDSDGWGVPNTTMSTLQALASTVAQTRLYLKTHFGMAL